MFKKVIEQFFRAPARALEKTVEFAEREERKIISKNPIQVAEEYWNTLGPGLTTGAADDDPSGVATYSQMGARYGFQLLWLSLFTFPFMAIVQEMCARIGLVTGQGLASNIRRHYPRRILYGVTALLFFANTLNIAADLGAMAASAKLLIPHINLIAFVAFFAIASLLLQIFTTYARYARYLKYTTLALFSYVFTAFAVHLNWREAFAHTLIPSFTFSKDQVFLVCAVLGTTISPYLFFWQTSQEVEEQILRGEKTIGERKTGFDARQLNHMRFDVWSGMFFSNAIMFFIIAACAATLYAHGITTITGAEQAALAIRPFAGELTYFFFAMGIIGTGLLATPVLAGSTAYALAESFNWKQGLYRKLSEAYTFYGVIIVSMLIGILMNFIRIDPIKALIYSAVANGFIAPIVLFFVVSMSASQKIMADNKNHPVLTACGWLIIAVMGFAGVAAMASLFL